MTKEAHAAWCEHADLVDAIIRGRTDEVRARVKRKPELLQSRLLRNGTPDQGLLHLVNMAEVVVALVDVARDTGHLIDIEGKNIGGFSPLVQAVSMGNFEVVEALLESGADPNRRTTHLPIAAAIGLPCGSSMIDLLLRRGAKPDGPEEGPFSPKHPHVETPLFKACWKGDTASALALLAGGADGHRVVNGRTAVQAAYAFQQESTAQAVTGWIQDQTAHQALQTVRDKHSKLQAGTKGSSLP